MSSINKAIIVGRVGKDPEIRYLASGDAVCNLSVATSESWKDKNTGEKKEATEWHRVSMYGKLAEITGQYVTKGTLVYIEGKIKTRKWKDKDGQDRYSTEIDADKMTMLGSKSDGQQRQQQSDGYGQAPSNQGHHEQSSRKQSFDDLGDDIPF